MTSGRDNAFTRRKAIAANFVPNTEFQAHSLVRLILYHTRVGTGDGLYPYLREHEFLDLLAPVPSEYPRDKAACLVPLSFCLSCRDWRENSSPSPYLFTDSCPSCWEAVTSWSDFNPLYENALDRNRYLWYYYPIPIRERAKEILWNQVFKTT